MCRTNNIRVRNAHSSGSALLCNAPGCYRTFTTTSGKTQHIRRMHPLPRRNRSETPICSSRPATPVPFRDESEMESSPRRGHVEIEDITGREDKYEDIYMPESPRLSPGARSEEPPVPEHNRHSSSPHQSQRATGRDHEVRDPPSTTRIFHPDLNGKLPGSTRLFKRLTILQGIPCDKDGNAVPQGTPPPPYDTDNGPDDWTHMKIGHSLNSPIIYSLRIKLLLVGLTTSSISGRLHLSVLTANLPFSITTTFTAQSIRLL